MLLHYHRLFIISKLQLPKAKVEEKEKIFFERR